MSRVLVSGLINLETTLKVERFPIEYSPVHYPFFGVRSTVSGVGYNLSKALTLLGEELRFLSLIGGDPAGELVEQALRQDGIPAEGVLRDVEQTAQSVILYDPDGRRQIHTDLKDLQERSYPMDRFREALDGCDLAVLCNINFSRPFLAEARRAGVPVATDVHTISSLDDGYNRDFMEAAQILFMSDELLPEAPEAWVRRLWQRCGTEIAVVGLGAQGALLGVRADGFLERVPAVVTRPVVSTIGAGDALLAAFVHGYLCDRDPYEAIRKAVVFASHKTGTAGAAEGFLDAAGLDALAARVQA